MFTSFLNMRFIGLVLLIAVEVCNCFEGFCPEGAQLFLVTPNSDGTCPDTLPTLETREEENENPCEQVVS